jgi:predicted phage baseplate assembly protein
MPLDAYPPRIDDRRFDDIMTEVRTRIARYTPEWTPVWTDVNETDPGVTMVEVFAWLTDLTLYRLNKVPALNYLKFLELIGIELEPAAPAQVDITFPVLPSAPAPYVIVPGATQLSADPGDGLPPTIFETALAMTALRARLTAVLAYDGFAYTILTTQNDKPDGGFQPFGPLANQGSALLLGLDAPIPGGIDLDLTFWRAPESKAPSPVSCGLPATRVYPSARLSWESWTGRAWQSLNLYSDETVSLTRSGHVHLKASQDVDQAADFGGVAGRYWIRARVVAGGYELPPDLFAIRFNTVAAIQAETIGDEVLGGSDGRPNQVFQLENSPVLAGSLVVDVDEGEGFEPWTEVRDALGSRRGDRHFVLNRTTGEVRFGDGVNGQIPVANPDNPGGNVVARSYRFGGGQRGNVGPGAVSTLQTSIAGIDETAIGNLQAAYAGRDEETLENAKKRAPQALKSQCRAVTGSDFEAAAEQAGNVKRALALPLAHPDFPETQVPGVVTVVVVPDAPTTEARPMPSEGLLRTVCAYLDQRRLLTTEVYVVAPTYQEVSVEVSIIVKNDSDLGAVKAAAETSLLDYFHPLRGGEDGQGWPFGGNVFYSRVQNRVFSVPGVERTDQLLITVDGLQAAECADVDIPAGVLLFSRENRVDVRYSFDE